MCGVLPCSLSSLLPPLLSTHLPPFFLSPPCFIPLIRLTHPIPFPLSSSSILSFFFPIPSHPLPIPQAAEECGSLEINSATDTRRALSRNMTGAKKEVREGQLFSLSGEPMESCAEVLGATSTTVGSSMAHLPTAANQGVQYGTHSSILSMFYKSH